MSTLQEKSVVLLLFAPVGEEETKFAICRIPAGTDYKIVIDNLDKTIREIWGDDISQPKITDFRECKNIDDVLRRFGLNESQIKKVIMRIPRKKR